VEPLAGVHAHQPGLQELLHVPPAGALRQRPDAGAAHQDVTKRAERIRDHLPADWGAGYENVWLGVSVEENAYCRRVDLLREVPARTRWVCAEPLLGPLPDLNLDGIHWLVVGGESGPNWRPMDLAWVRALRDKSRAAGTAFYFKQTNGLYPGKEARLDGQVYEEWPETPGVALPLFG
jgi:protein gp37